MGSAKQSKLQSNSLGFSAVFKRAWPVFFCGFVCKLFEAFDQDLFQAFVRSLVVCDHKPKEHQSNHEEFSGSAYCADKLLTINEATDFLGDFSLANFSPRIFLYPFMGAAADAIGRKPFMVISFLGISVMLLCFTIGAATKSKNMLLAGGFVHGTTFFVYPLALTMLADLSTPSERNEFMALYVFFDVAGTAVALCSSVFMLNLYLTEYFNVWGSLFCVSVAVLVFVILEVEETHKNVSATPLTWADLSPVSAFRILWHHKFLQLLALALLLCLVAFIGFLITLTPFLVAHGFTQVTALLAQGTTLVATVAAVPVNQWIHQWGGEMQAVKIGLVTLMLGMLVIATCAPFSTTSVWPGLALVGAGLGLALPSLKALVSMQVEDLDQAKMQSVMGSFILIGVTLGSFLFAKTLFDASDTGYAAGKPFFVSAAVIGATTLLLVYAEKHHQPKVEEAGEAVQVALRPTDTLNVTLSAPPSSSHTPSPLVAKK